MANINKTIYLFIIVVLVFLFIFSSINIMNYIRLIEEKYDLLDNLTQVRNENIEIQKEINEFIEKKNFEALKYYLLKKDKNERFIIIHDKEKIREGFVYQNKTILLFLYFFGGIFFFAIVLLDYFRISKAEEMTYSKAFKYYKGVNQRT